MTYKLHTNDLRMTQEILNCIKDIELSDQIFKIVCGKIIALGGYVVPIPVLFTRIFLSLATGSGNLNNLKGNPYYIL